MIADNVSVLYDVADFQQKAQYEAPKFELVKFLIEARQPPYCIALVSGRPSSQEEIKMETKIVYRIENPEDKDGMWYTKDGILRKKIHILCPDGIAKDFPMPFNPIHKKDGHIWQSAGKNVENMNQWFTASDAINLFNNGFKLFEFETTMFQELEMEVLFCRKGVIKQREIPLESIWDIASVIGHS